jgi:hypothetical protein
MSDELRLSLLRQPGIGSPTILALASSSILAASEEGVRVLGAPLSETERDILQQAKLVLQKNAAATPPRWQARCHGQALACAVNDTRLKQGESLPIQPGDRIDIGLLRLGIVPADETASRSWQQESEPSGKEATPAESFELDRLADTPQWEAPDKENNPFDLIGVHDTRLDDAQQDSPEISETPAPAPEEDILVRLANEYAQVILNPDHLLPQPLEETTPAPENPAVSYLDISHHGQEWKTDQSLEDFVAGKLTIQAILDRLGIDDFQPLEVSEPVDEVLALFAQDRVLKRTERLPARTRRDHHRISLDSYYQPEESSGNPAQVQKPDTDS